MTAIAFESYGVELDDWLALYTFRGGELDGHQAVRVTELWWEWLGQETGDPAKIARAESLVLARADELGPPAHDPAWCAACAFAGDL